MPEKISRPRTRMLFSSFCLFILTFPIRIRLRRKLDRTRATEASSETLTLNEDGIVEDEPRHNFDHHVETGFQLATFQGPLCFEPVEGMAYFLESLEVAQDEAKSETGSMHFPIWFLRNVD